MRVTGFQVVALAGFFCHANAEPQLVAPGIGGPPYETLPLASVYSFPAETLAPSVGSPDDGYRTDEYLNYLDEVIAAQKVDDKARDYAYGWPSTTTRMVSILPIETFAAGQLKSPQELKEEEEKLPDADFYHLWPGYGGEEDKGKNRKYPKLPEDDFYHLWPGSDDTSVTTVVPVMSSTRNTPAETTVPQSSDVSVLSIFTTHSTRTTTSGEVTPPVKIVPTFVTSTTTREKNRVEDILSSALKIMTRSTTTTTTMTTDEVHSWFSTPDVTTWKDGKSTTEAYPPWTTHMATTFAQVASEPTTTTFVTITKSKIY